jgi:hypothetical protein
MLDTTQTDPQTAAQTDTPLETPEQARARIDAMPPSRFRGYTDRLRRMAYRQGLIMRKTRTRDPRALTFKGYTLTDMRAKKVVLGPRKDGYWPEVFEVEWYLTR